MGNVRLDKEWQKPDKRKHQMNNKTLIQKAWGFRLAVVWFILFSLVALSTAIYGSLTGAQWSELDGQSKFMICLAVFANWGGTMMAFISKQAKKIEEGGDLFRDTGFLKKSDVQEKVADMPSQQPGKPA
jgi:hypothetical protein